MVNKRALLEEPDWKHNSFEAWKWLGQIKLEETRVVISKIRGCLNLATMSPSFCIQIMARSLKIFTPDDMLTQIDSLLHALSRKRNEKGRWHSGKTLIFESPWVYSSSNQLLSANSSPDETWLILLKQLHIFSYLVCPIKHSKSVCILILDT